MKIATQNGGWDSSKAVADKIIEIVRTHLETPLERRDMEDVVLWSRGLTHYYLEKVKGQFHIFIGGGRHTTEYEPRHPLEKMWGVKTGFRECGCGKMHQPTGQGLLVIEPESAYPVAELIDDNLFILFNLNDRTHLDDERSFKILGKILEEVADLLGGNFPSLEKLASGEFVLPKATTTRRYQQLLQTARKDLSARITQASRLQQQIASLRNQVPQASKILEGIARIPEVKEVEVSGRKMVITTHVMYGLHPKTKKIHEYGRFRIEFTFGENFDVIFKNLDRRPFKDEKGTYGHPHVDRQATGFWCQGEGEAINPLMRSFEYEAAILFALKAIESVNDEVGRGNYLEVLSAFPIVKERAPYPTGNAVISVETKAAFARIFDVSGEPVREMQNQFTAKVGEVQRIQARIARMLLEQGVREAIQSAGTTKDPGSVVAQMIRQQIEVVEKMPGVNAVQIEKNLLTIKLARANVSFNFATGEILLRKEEKFRLSELWMTLPELFGGMEWETALNLIQIDLAANPQMEMVP